MAISLPTIGARARDIIGAVLPSALAAGVMAGMIWALSPIVEGLPAFVRLAFLVVTGAVIYLGISWILQRRTIEDLLGVWRTKRVISIAA